MIETVINLRGEPEPYDAEHYMHWVQDSVEGFDKNEWFSIAIEVATKSPKVITVQKLMKRLIDEVLKRNTWTAHTVAGRLLAILVRMEVFGSKTPPKVREVQTRLAKQKLMRVLKYKDSEWELIEQAMRHDLDAKMPHYALEQIRYKYSLQDFQTKTEFETSQFVYMRMAMAVFEGHKETDQTVHLKSINSPFHEEYEKRSRVEHVIRIYRHFSDKYLSAPTPNYNNLGTFHNGLASCCVIAVGDDRFSLNVGDTVAYLMTTESAGIGNNIMCRSIGDAVRSGAFLHQGKRPYIDAYGKMTKANIQGGRGGAANFFASIYDPEIKMILALRDPRATEEYRNRDLHYAFLTNRFFAAKFANEEDIFQWNCYTAPDLNKAFYGPDLNKFIELYEKYEADETFKKVYVSARDLMIHALTEGVKSGSICGASIDEMNRNTPFIDPIRSSNLCVAPETLLLTSKGHLPIVTLEGKETEIWNGEEWSVVTVKKTGTDQPLLKVTLSDGKSLECTEYHKWYVQNEYGGEVVEKRTNELLVGDKLIKLQTKPIEGNESFTFAYLNGFFTGDGCQLRPGYARIDLFGEKKKLFDKFGINLNWRQNKNPDRLESYVSGLKAKYFVPDATYSIPARLEWLAGWLDADGTVHRNGDNETFHGSSNNKEFLLEIQLMLQTLGVESKVASQSAEGKNWLPKNDGSGESTYYHCKKVFRISLSSVESQKLVALKLPIHRLKLVLNQPQRAASLFVKVTGIVDEGRIDDTYCVTEPKRHMAVFNGILTGQCMEVALPTQPYEGPQAMMDLFSTEEVGYAKFRAKLLDPTPETRSKNFDRIEFDCKASDVFRDENGNRWSAGFAELGRKIRVEDGGVYVIDKIHAVKPEPEVALCSLASTNVTETIPNEVYRDVMYYAYRMIDNSIENNTYILPHIGVTAKARRNAGVGMMGVATHMARNKLKYTTKEGLKELHKLAERHWYYAVEAALQISKERGLAPWMHRSKFADGWSPLDTYRREIDDLADFEYYFDHEEQRQRVIANGGLAFSALVNYMPGESSSKALGVCNSYYPTRELVMIKTDMGIELRWTAPYGDDPEYEYQSVWDTTLLEQNAFHAPFTKWSDQATSADKWLNFTKRLVVPSEELLDAELNRVTLGTKTYYYTNTLMPSNETNSMELSVSVHDQLAEQELEKELALAGISFQQVNGDEKTDCPGCGT